MIKPDDGNKIRTYSVSIYKNKNICQHWVQSVLSNYLSWGQPKYWWN